MSHWLDLATIGEEAALCAAIDALSLEERQSLTQSLCSVLFISPLDVEKSVLRILIERSRAMALPKALWSRSLFDSSSVDSMSTSHLASLGVMVTTSRVDAMRRMYTSFADTRSSKPPLSITMMNSVNWRCSHCGLAFCDEDVAYKGWVSPHGSRGPLKVDPFKQHWNPALAKRNYRSPTVDHDWPVSTFGDNTPPNLRVMCRGCNEGKRDIVAGEQSHSWVGMHSRTQFLSMPLPIDVFYAQLRRSPKCEMTGKTAAVIELTVTLRDPNGIPCFDNLVTIESP